jgi:hypothetical protein
MKTTEIYPGRYLKAADVEPAIIVTINALTFEELGQEKTRKFVIWFDEIDQGLVVNKTNLRSLEAILGTAETDDWLGGTIELYKDFVQMGGDIVGATRVRPAREPVLAI